MSAEVTSSGRGPRGPLLALCIGAAAMFTAFFMTATLAPLLGGALGASPGLIGIIISAAFVLPFFLAIPVGTLVDATGAKPMLLTGVTLLAAAPVLIVVAPSLVTLIGVQVLAGLGQLISVVAAQSIVASLGSGPLRERNFGWYGAFVSIGQFAGPLSAGVLVDLAGFRSAYAVVGVAALAALGSYLAVRLPDRVTGEGTGEVPREGTGVASPRRARLPSVADVSARVNEPGPQISLWVSGTVMIVLLAHNSFLPAFLDELTVPASVIGIIISVRSAASVLIRPFMATVIRTLGGRVRTYVATLTACALGVAGIVAAPHLGLLLGSSLLLGLGVGVAQPLTMVTMVDRVPIAEHGVALGIRITVNRLVQVLAPLLLGVIAQATGYGSMFVVASLVIASTAVALIGRRTVYRSVEAE